MEAFIIVNILTICWYLLTRRHYYGLLGAYGKGVWSASSFHRVAAANNYILSTICLVIVLIIDLIILTN